MAVSQAAKLAIRGSIISRTGANALINELDVPEGSTGVYIETGTYQSTAGGGITLSSSNNRPVSFLFDDNGAAMTGDIRAVLSRVLVTVDQATPTINALRGQIKMLDGVDISSTAVVSPITGYFEMAGTSARTLTGHVAGIRAALEEGSSGTTTIAASSYYAGFEATLNSTRTYSVTGTMAAFMCNISGGTSVWPVGFLVDDSSCTTGIEIGAVTTGITFSSTLATGISFSSATFVPDTSRTDIAIEVGSRASELTVTMAADTGQNFDPIQTNINIAGSNPSGSSTVNTIYQNITHDTTDMSNIRLKCADWNIAVAKNVKDVYVYQGEVDFSGTCTVNSECAVMGLTLNCGSGTLSGNVYGQIIITTGSSIPSGTSSALFLSHRGGTLTRSLYIECNSSQTITNAIYLNPAGTITNVLNINTPGNTTNFLLTSTNGGCVGSGDKASGGKTYHLVCSVGGAAKFIQLYDV